MGTALPGGEVLQLVGYNEIALHGIFAKISHGIAYVFQDTDNGHPPDTGQYNGGGGNGGFRVQG